MKLRYASQEDIPTIVDGVIKHFYEMPLYEDDAPDREWLTDVLTNIIDADTTFCRMADDEDGLSVLWLAVAGPGWLNKKIAVHEMMMWIREDLRGLRLFRGLLQDLEDWGSCLGATRVALAATTGYRTEATAKLYERCGYTYQGPQYTKEL